MLTFEQAMALKEGDKIYVDGAASRVFRLRSNQSKKTVLIRYTAYEYLADVFEIAHDAPAVGLTRKTSSVTKELIKATIERFDKKYKKAEKLKKAKKAKKSKKSKKA